MVGQQSSKPTTAQDVLLYIPNLIGYARVACTLASFVLMICSPSQWLLAIMLYVSSFVGDLFDGWAARKFDQCSDYGGMLDMVTDRCSTLGLLFVLAQNDEKQQQQQQHAITDGFFASAASAMVIRRLMCLSLMVLDISSHWCQMYATASLQLHHKSFEGNSLGGLGPLTVLVRLYYQSYALFGYCCVGAEFTYIFWYILEHVMATAAGDGGGSSSLPVLPLPKRELVVTIVKYLFWIVLPGCLVKQIVNVSQLCSACHAVATYDAEQKNNNNNKKKS